MTRRGPGWWRSKSDHKAVAELRFVLDGDGGEDWRWVRGAARFDPTVVKPKFKRYRVERGKKALGYIVQDRYFTYRKAGRLIVHSWHPRCWRIEGPWQHQEDFKTRFDAALELLRRNK